MSRSEPDATRIVRSWLEEGATALPDSVLDAVLDQLPATPQRRPSWLAWRTPTMNNTVRLIAVAAALVAVAFIGYQLLLAPNVGGPAPSETPGPADTPAPTPAAIIGLTDLEPGTYSIGSYFPVQFDLTITDNWEKWGASERIVRIWKPCDPSPCTGFSDVLTFEIVSGAFSDPCRAIPGPPLGPGVDELVNALTNLPGFEASPVTDVSVDGHPGKSFALTFIGPADESCVDGGTWQWTSDDAVGWGVDNVQRVIILDVDGTRLVVDAVRYGSDGQEMNQIIDTIQFK